MIQMMRRSCAGLQTRVDGARFPFPFPMLSLLQASTRGFPPNARAKERVCLSWSEVRSSSRMNSDRRTAASSSSRQLPVERSDRLGDRGDPDLHEQCPYLRSDSVDADASSRGDLVAAESLHREPQRDSLGCR